MVDIQEIKKQFPDPKTCPPRKVLPKEGEYCVGGAVMCFAYKKHLTSKFPCPFPGKHDLSTVLMDLNPRLNRFVADVFSARILTRNDQERFDPAWDQVEMALNLYKGDN